MKHTYYDVKEAHWNQWFAGLVDADGCLLTERLYQSRNYHEHPR